MHHLRSKRIQANICIHRETLTKQTFTQNYNCNHLRKDVKIIPLKDTSNDVYYKLFFDPITRTTTRELTEICLSVADPDFCGRGCKSRP